MVPIAKSPYWKHRQRLVRTPEIPNAIPEKLDPGVAYFVLMLEKLGAQTRFSCEGHPNGFYISFIVSYELAKKIHGCGFFSVEIEGRGIHENYRSLRIHYPQETVRDHNKTLGWASAAWEKAFGSL